MHNSIALQEHMFWHRQVRFSICDGSMLHPVSYRTSRHSQDIPDRTIQRTKVPQVSQPTHYRYRQELLCVALRAVISLPVHSTDAP